MDKGTSHFKSEIRELLRLKKSSRPPHIPVLAALSVGAPLIAGILTNHFRDGITASMAGLVILYMPVATLKQSMFRLLACSVGFVMSFFIGLLFSFNLLLFAFVLGIYTFFIHLIVRYFNVKPPGNFFFIMLAAIAGCMPFKPELILYKTALIAAGTLITCAMAFVYTLIFTKEQITGNGKPQKNKHVSVTEAFIYSIFISASLLLAYILEFKNPYWVPISCLAIMQGINVKHVWHRSLQRITGTFLGLGLAWVLLVLHLPVWAVCVAIICLQYIVEVLITRNYGYAVIFITTMTILLAEYGNPVAAHPNVLITIRFIDILTGSVIGAAGGWLLYHRALKWHIKKHIRKTKVYLKK